MKISHSEHEQEPEIQLAPFIDCLLFLLIFFMSATTLGKSFKAVEVNLPAMDAAYKVKQGDRLLVITIERSGKVSLDGQATGTAALFKQLRAAAQANLAQRIRIDADQQAPMQTLLMIINQCQYEGLKNIGFRGRDGA